MAVSCEGWQQKSGPSLATIQAQVAEEKDNNACFTSTYARVPLLSLLGITLPISMEMICMRYFHLRPARVAWLTSFFVLGLIFILVWNHSPVDSCVDCHRWVAEKGWNPYPIGHNISTPAGVGALNMARPTPLSSCVLDKALSGFCFSAVRPRICMVCFYLPQSQYMWWSFGWGPELCENSNSISPAAQNNNKKKIRLWWLQPGDRGVWGGVGGAHVRARADTRAPDELSAVVQVRNIIRGSAESVILADSGTTLM